MSGLRHRAAWIAGLLACTVLAWAGSSGVRYIFCEPMQRVLRAPCCPSEVAAGHDEPEPLAAIGARCCESRAQAALSPARPLERERLDLTLAWVPVAHRLSAALPPPAALRLPAPRASGPPRPGPRLHARLSVWLC